MCDHPRVHGASPLQEPDDGNFSSGTTSPFPPDSSGPEVTLINLDVTRKDRGYLTLTEDTAPEEGEDSVDGVPVKTSPDTRLCRGAISRKLFQERTKLTL